jgi:hypothetical protein
MGHIEAYRLAEVTEDFIQQGINTAPQYGRNVASAIRHTIRVIHGLPQLYNTLELKDLNIYLGRAAASPRHVLTRWKFHQKKRTHKWGTILFTCRTDRAIELEGIAIKVLCRFKKHGALCVGQANAGHDGRGGKAANGLSVIYMTWGDSIGSIDYERPGIKLIVEVASAVSREVGRVVNRQQLVRGLKILKRLREQARLKWAEL